MLDTTQHIDCETCPVRGLHCDECMVTAFLAIDTADQPLDAVEQRAVGVFAAAGLISDEEVQAAVSRREPIDAAAWASVG